VSPVTNGIAALVAYHARDYARAIGECERALEIEPSSFLARLAITLSYAAQGNHDSAIEQAMEGVRLSPDALFLRGLLGAVYGMAGKLAQSDDVLADVVVRGESAYVSPVLLSWVHSHAGRRDAAFASLEAAFQERSCSLGFGVRFPIYDGIRSDERFADLLERMDLH